MCVGEHAARSATAISNLRSVALAAPSGRATFRAVLSTATVDAKDRMPDTCYQSVLGYPLATGSADFFRSRDFEELSDETGRSSARFRGDGVWTGMTIHIHRENLLLLVV
jgi:hypothetical protein